MILGRDLLTELGLDLKFSGNVIHGGEGPYKGCSAPTVDVNNDDFTNLTAKTVKPEEYFINAYVNECFKSKSEISATRRMHRILDDRYKNVDLNKVITKQCQYLNDE